LIYRLGGDGLDDLIIGALHADVSGKSKAGKSYVIFGKKDSTAIDLSAIASGNGTGGFVINGENANDNNQIIQAIAVNIACVGD
jgi:hypothetical protein